MNYLLKSGLDTLEEPFGDREIDRHEKDPADYFFIPDNYEYRKIRLSDILYLEADGSYVKILTHERSFQISTNLKNFSDQFRHPDFIRVSRKHIVNIKYTERINGVFIALKDKAGQEFKIPFSKRKRNEILSVLPVIRITH